MEHTIGDIFDYCGHTLRVEPSNDSCCGCFFNYKNFCTRTYHQSESDEFKCTGFRKDKQPVIFKEVKNMKEETKEIKINVPEGYKIDKEKSTFERIILKKIEEKPWRYNKKTTLDNAWYISDDCHIISAPRLLLNTENNHNVFATEKQAKSALAMAQISQIMANDKRFGGVVTDEEWKDPYKTEFVINRCNNDIQFDTSCVYYYFLAFHTKEQRDLFLKENEDLIKDYLMID